MDEDFPVDTVESGQVPLDSSQSDAENCTPLSQQQLLDGVLGLGSNPAADAEQAEVRRQLTDRVIEVVTRRTGVVSVIKEIFGYKWLSSEDFERLKDEIFSIAYSEPGLRRAGKNNVAPELNPSGINHSVKDGWGQYRRSQSHGRSDEELDDMLGAMHFGRGGKSSRRPERMGRSKGKRGRRQH